MSKTRKVLALIATASFLVACSASDDDATGGDGVANTSQAEPSASDATQDEPETEQVHLTVWGWRAEDADVYDEMFEQFSERHPHITAEYVGYKGEEYDTILSTGLSGDGGPDVVQLRSYGLMQPLAEAGYLVPLDGEINDLDGFSPEVLDGARGTADGRVYGVPFAIQTLHVFYNVELFEEHDVAVPAKWEDMMAACETFTGAGITPIAATVADTWMLPIEHEVFGAATYGGHDLKAELLSGTADFTDPRWVSSVEAWGSTKACWGDLWEGNGYTDAQTLFNSGAAAMFPGGIWELAGFVAANPELEVGIFSVPAAPGGASDTVLTPGFVDGSFGVSSRSAKREAALELTSWMASSEFGQMFSDQLKQISAVPGVVPSDPVLAEAVADFAEHPSPYLSYAYFSGGTPDGWTLEQQALSDFILGKATAEQAAGSIQKGINQWFDPGD